MKKVFSLLFVLTTITTPQTFGADRGWDYIDDWSRESRFERYRERQCGYRSYNGNMGRFNHRMSVTNPQCQSGRDRHPIAGQICQFCNDLYKHPQQIESCKIAMLNAQRFARLKEGAAGRRDGFLRGYSCGVDSGIDDNVNDRYAMDSGRGSVRNMEREIINGAERIAAPKGLNDGRPHGQSLATRQYSEATRVGGGSIPEKNPGNPLQYVSYSGEVNGYEIMGHRVRSESELIEDGELRPYDFFELDRNVRDDYRSYYDDDYSRGYRRREFYKGRKQYYDYQYDRRFPRNFNQSALDIWRRRAPRQQLDQYFSLSDQPIVVEVETGKDEQGNPIKRQESLVSQRRVFEESFQEGYQFFGPFIYERFYRMGLEDGYDIGYPLGEKTGREMAYDEGQRQQYNSDFQYQSRKEYERNFDQAFRLSYAANFDNLKSTSQLESARINKSQIQGEVNDGAVTPGEKIKVSYTIRNIGGQSGQVQSEINGISVGSSTVGALTEKDITTAGYVITAPQVSDITKESTEMTISLKATNGKESRSDSILVVIENIFGIGNNEATSKNNYLQGQLSLPVTVRNPRSVKSTESASINLYVNDQLSNTVQIGVLEARQSRDLQLDFLVDDPLTLLGKTFVLRAELIVSGKTMQMKTSRELSVDERMGLIEYFGAVINGNGKIPNHLDRLSRENELIEKFRSIHRSNLLSMKDELSKLSKRDIERKGVPDYLGLKTDSTAISVKLAKNRPAMNNADAQKAIAKLAIYLEYDGKCMLEDIAKVLRGTNYTDVYKKDHSKIINELLDDTGYDGSGLFSGTYSKKGDRLKAELGVPEKIKCK